MADRNQRDMEFTPQESQPTPPWTLAQESANNDRRSPAGCAEDTLLCFSASAEPENTHKLYEEMHKVDYWKDKNEKKTP